MQSSCRRSGARHGALNKLFRTDKTKNGHTSDASSISSSVQHAMPKPVVGDLSELTGDFAKLVIEHEPLQAPSGVGYPQMKAVLQGFTNLADGAFGVPGLKSAFKMVLQIVQTAEMAKNNREMCFDIAQHTYELLNLMKEVNHPNDQNLQDISDALTKELDSVYVAINTLITRNWLKHAFHASEEKDAINKCEKFLDWSLLGTEKLREKVAA
ncbi:hypothetical protein AX17_004047, partial [Amanita inopinata Kibby_2008]